ncbi:MAG TPA: DNA repair protein RecN [Ignavibacteriaceae bacterium]|nr:DNA repair protein RecN [Ignavibacteriaceae bacterium]
MLKSLYIKDYALIELLNIEFQSGLNIITGETGAGKSILIDAMGLLLGERASGDVIRKGASKAIVEGIFDVSNNKKISKLLDDNEIDYSDELIMRRELSLKGNRCFINDSPVPLNIIKEAGYLLVDLHGQHEHQSLLRPEMHIEFLDDFSNNDTLFEKYTLAINQLNRIQKELRELRERESILKEKKELYSFHIREIDNISPLEDEDNQISEELKILENSEKLLELTSSIYGLIYENEDSTYDSLAKIKTQLDELNGIDKSFSEIAQEAASALSIVDDIKSYVRNYNSQIDIDPQKLDSLRNRLLSINSLKKKFGGSVKSILEYRKKIGDEFELAESFEENILSIQKNLTKQRELCGKFALELSETRKKSAKQLSKNVIEELSSLGISNANFDVQIMHLQNHNGSGNFVLIDNVEYLYDSSGIDKVEFYISTNLGEDLKPLAKVASGGEVSRVMLALKSSLAKNDKLPLLIFDEIDTGVSGRIAQKVGLALKSLAKYHQIIAITHLPQIAGLGDVHFMVEKNDIAGRVVSTIKMLTAEERIREVAKLMSGEEITDSSLKSARELMGIQK